MPRKKVCLRCGGPLVAEQCPACGNSSAEVKAQRQAVRRRAFVGVGSGAAGMVILVLGLFLLIKHRPPPQWTPRSTAARPRWQKHEGPVAQLSELHGHGIIYLVQLTPHTAAYSADDLAQWLRTRFGLDARSLPPEPLPKSAWHGWRRQYVAELLYAEIKREHPALAVNDDAYLIGLTDADMYSVLNHWSSTFTQRDGKRAAIISSAELEDNPRWWGLAKQKAAKQDLQARMRRVLLKDVAMLYWHLPINNDPTSLLHQPEDPDLPTEDIYESDLDPARTRWGQLEGEPCLYFRYSAKDGLQIVPGRLIRTCQEISTPQEDESTELFEVDLRLGTMMDRRTDVWIPGAMPIAFERALRPGWKGDNSFGISGADSYDSFLASRENIYIWVISDDGGRAQLVRDPIWLSYLPLAKYVDTEFSGQFYQMRWRTIPYPHYDLRRFDGEVESYLPCYSSTQFCYLNGVRDADGQELKFQRDGNRRLLQVTSSDGSWLKLRYGTGFRIEEADDSRGRTVRYGYNKLDQLTSVTYSSGETLSFDYDNANELTAFSASPDIRTKPIVLLRSNYDHGMLKSQTLADGSSYLYSYGPVNDLQTRTAMVQTPDGKVYAIRRYGDLSLVWKRDTGGENIRGQ
jgi:YD repeat-containing protein